VILGILPIDQSHTMTHVIGRPDWQSGYLYAPTARLQAAVVWRRSCLFEIGLGQEDLMSSHLYFQAILSLY